MRILCTLVTVCSFAILALGLWIPFKAVVAQELLQLAWAESQARRTQVRPWPWADTWPVARLSYDYDDGVNGHQQSLIVLDGAHGESLAFGPGQVFGDDRHAGPTVIAGHRDTHFSSLRYLKPGSELRLQKSDGQWRSFRVAATRVVDSRRQQIDTANLPPDALILVTCYPFDNLQSLGPLRYVVEARVEAKASNGNLIATVVER